MLLSGLWAQAPDTLGCGNMRREGKALCLEQDYDRALRVYGLAAKRYQRAGYTAAYLETQNEIADVLLDAGRYEAAFSTLKTALQSGENQLGLPNPVVAMTRYLLGSTCLYLSQYEEAVQYFRQAKLARIQLFGNTHPLVAKADFSLGISFDFLARTDSALYYLKKALEVQEEVLGPEDLETGATCNSIGIVYSNLGSFDSTRVYYQRAMDIRLNKLGPDHPELAHNYHNMGILYYEKGDAGEAIKWLNKGLALRQKTYGLQHPQLFSSLYEMGFAYQDQGDYERARDYFRQARDLVFNTMGKDHYYLSYVYSSLGNLFHGIGVPDSALYYHQLALEINRNLFGEGQDQLTKSFNNLAVVLEGMGRYREAQAYLEKSLAIRLRTRGPSHHTLAFIYEHLGNCYRDQGKVQEAQRWHRKALAVHAGNLGPTHPDQAGTYLELATDYMETGDFVQADSMLQAALHILLYPQDPDIWLQQPAWDAVRHPLSLIRVLERQTRLAQQMGQPEKALTYAEKAIEMMLYLQQSYRARESRLFLLEKGSSLFETAIALAWENYQNQQDIRYLQQAISFAGQSQSNLLRASLAESEARQFAGIPDEVLLREAELRIDLAYYENKLYNGEEEKVQLEEKVFELKRAYDQLLEELEQDYPRYHQLKYRISKPDIPDIQNRLAEDETLLLYFCGTHTWYAFWLRKDTLGAMLIGAPEAITDSLPDFLRYLQDGEEAASQANNPVMVANFSRKAAYLGQQLLPPAVMKPDASLPRLTIIPDGRLNYLPFEVLLSKGPDSADSFSTLPFLLHSYRIRYIYRVDAFTLLAEEPSLFIRRMAGFAPVHSDVDPSLAPLPGSKQEVTAIASLIGGTTYLEEEATESNFKEKGRRFRILHLSMHGFLNDQRPLFSGLVFSSETDTSTGQDGILHGYELFNQDLQAEMVVLSACQTQAGTLARGEGIMSLSRAFQYAGCPSLVSSLWQADDQSTAQLMAAFYRYLKAGNQKEEALRNAKLELLNEGRRSHPHYWATFLLIGDPAPLQLWAAWPWVLAGLLGLMLVLGFIWRKTKLF